jgi:hypothetical protein
LSTASAYKALLVVNVSWCAHGNGHAQKLQTRHLIGLSDHRPRVHAAAGEVTLRFRDTSGNLRLDDNARLFVSEETGRIYLHSDELAPELLSKQAEGKLLFVHVEQAADVVRATVNFSSARHLEKLSQERPELRLQAYDLPPRTITEIEPSFSRDGMDADSLYEVLMAWLQKDDPELFAVHTEKFLKAPHLLVPLLSHLASLSADENLKFPVQLRRLSDQFREILEMKDSAINIKGTSKNSSRQVAANLTR